MSVKQTVNTNSGVSTTTRTGLVFYNDRISGILTTVDVDDVVSKNYVDNTPGVLNVTEADEGNFLTSFDGVSESFQSFSNSQEYTTPGTYTFNLPPYANLLYVQAVNGGDGGSSGRNVSLSENFQFEEVDDVVTSGSSSSSNAALITDDYFLASNGFNCRLYSSTDSFSWELIYTPPSAKSAQALKYVNGYYFFSTLGSTSITVKSIDTETWDEVIYPNHDSNASGLIMEDMIYAKNEYIMLTQNSRIHVSTDSIHWTARTTGSTSSSGSIFYDETTDTYLYGTQQYIEASSDTIHWARRTAPMGGPGSGTLGIVKKPNTDFVLACYDGNAAVSTDTIIWTARTSIDTSIISRQDVQSLLCYDDYYITSSFSGFIKSTDSIAWEYEDYTYVDGITVSSSSLSAGRNSLLYVSGGSAPAATTQIYRLKYSGLAGSASDYSEWYLPKSLIYSNLTIDVGSGGIGATTVDTAGQVGSATTISWTGPNGSSYKVSPNSSTSISGNSLYNSTGTSSNQLLIIDDNTNGNDGVNQTNKNQSTNGGSGALEDAVGGNGGEIYDFGFGEKASGGYGFEPSELDGQSLDTTFPYGGGGGGGSVSAGYSWTLRTSGKNPLNATVYSSVINDNYYILGGQGFILSSTDTIVWEEQNEGGNFNVYGLTKSPEFFLAAGGPNGYVSTSTDSTVWILRTSGFTDDVQQAIYDDNQFIISGDNAFLAVSTDAIHWTKRTTGVPVTDTIKGLGYANGYYFIGYSNATPSVSTDTITWIKRTAFIDSHESFGYQNGYYVMYDGGSGIISSTDTVIWISRTVGNSDGGIGNNTLTVTPTGFIIPGRNGSNTDYWYSTSTDSITWVVRTSDRDLLTRTIEFGNGYAIASGDDAHIDVSPVYIGSGGNGFRGGGGGGGAVGFGTFGSGGNGGDGYVKITWW